MSSQSLTQPHIVDRISSSASLRRNVGKRARACASKAARWSPVKKRRHSHPIEDEKKSEKKKCTAERSTSVFIFRCSSTTTNPVCERRVNLLVYSLSLHRHSYIGFILAFASSIHNKQTNKLPECAASPSPPSSLTQVHRCIGSRHAVRQTQPTSATLTYLSLYDNRDGVSNVQLPRLPPPHSHMYTGVSVLST